MNKIVFLKIKKNLPFYSSNHYIKDLRRNGANIGDGCVFYKPNTILIDLTSLEFINIGNNVQITDGVKILAHDYSYSVVANLYNEIFRPQKQTIIGNNVFIGMNTIVLMGSNIGDNVIIGAGSVVHGKLDSNYVYAGNPAKKICSIEEYKNKLQNNYEESAKCFFDLKGSKDNNMNIYKSLYTSEKEMVDYINNIKPIGLSDNALKNMKFKKKYNSMNDFLSNSKNGDV